ncbi:MAG: ATP-dependent Clp protease ATP-binding subunit ClpX [Polyangia bacterium]|jgi:ATP-dependent Clp protease ATP-binding subunit ClpX|nr:ATP-dependent Clp protease ATP-binding subunit ClpX [Polyangia bacterium]
MTGMDNLSCSFCGKNRREVRKLISGPKVFICDECVSLCNEIIAREDASPGQSFPKPKEIFKELDEYIIGQGRAKKVLSVAVYNHYKRLGFAKQRSSDVDVSKGNILMIGPTGVGKTLLAQTLARRLDVPLAMSDATTLTEAGYVGEDVESVVKALYRAAGGDVEKAERGIIFLDEVDKIARRGSGPSTTRDVSGEGVQQGLLKILEGKKTTITPDGARNRPQQDLVQIDTTNILFICSGSFTGLEEIIRRRMGDRGLGFGARVDPRQEDLNAIRAEARAEDLIKYGMIPEFMGRLPVIVACDDLSVADLVEVLYRPKNSLVRQYQCLFELERVKLRIEKDGMRAIAEEAAKRKSGARGLRSILEEVMLDVMYELPSLTGVTECLIDEDVILGNAEPTLVRAKKAS